MEKKGSSEPRELSKETFVKKGDSLELRILMDVTEPLDVIWEKDGIMISDGVDANIETGFDGVCNYLRLKRIDSEDFGTYEVFGEKGEEEVAHRTNVIVDGKRKPPPPVVPRKTRSIASSGASSPSSVKSPPPTPPKKPVKSPPVKSPPVTAQKPSRQSSVDSTASEPTQKPKKIPPKTPPKSVKSPKAKKASEPPSLSRSTSVDSTMSADQDSIGKISRNLKQVADKISGEENLEKNLPFTIEKKLKPVVVEEGDDAIISVTLSKTPDTIKWFINNKEIEDSTDHAISSEENKLSLIMANCKMSDDKKSVKFTAFSSGEELSGSIRLKVQAAVPGLKVKTQTKEQYVVGDDIVFDVLIKGHNEPYNIVWYNGFKKIKHMQNMMEINNESNRTTLTIKNATMDDGGVYKVSVKSAKGSSDLKYPPIKMKPKKEPITHEKRKAPVSPPKDTSRKSTKQTAASLSRESSIASTGSSEVAEESPIQAVVESEVSQEPTALPDVEIVADTAEILKDQSESDNDKTAKKSAKKTPKEEVVVDDGPPFVIEEKLKPVVVEEGESAIFSVTLSREADQLIWSIDNKEITNSNKHSIESNGSKYTVKFNQCTMVDDKKSLKFVATSHDNKELAGSIRMKIQAAVPGLKPLNKLNQDYFVGDHIQLDVLIKGHREPYKVEWSKGFKKINPAKSEVTIDSNVATLLLKDLTASDAGSYKCTIKSSKGSSEFKFPSFKVKGLLN